MRRIRRTGGWGCALVVVACGSAGRSAPPRGDPGTGAVVGAEAGAAPAGADAAAVPPAPAAAPGDAPAAPPPATDRDGSAGASPAPPEAAPPGVPARFSLVAEIPGPDRGRFLNVDVDVAADAFTMTGCESSGRGGCRRTRRVDHGAAERAELGRLWAAAVAAPPCRLTELADGRPFVVTWDGGEMAGDLPGDGASPDSLFGVDCAAPHRLVVQLMSWFQPLAGP